MAGREEGWLLEELVEASGSGAEEIAGTLKRLRRHDVTIEQDSRVGYASELLRRWVAGRENKPPRADVAIGRGRTDRSRG